MKKNTIYILTLILILGAIIFTINHSSNIKQKQIQTEKSNLDSIEDSLIASADQMVDEVLTNQQQTQHIIEGLDENVKTKQLTIKEQLSDLQNKQKKLLEMEDLAEAKKIEAEIAAKEARIEQAYADTLYSQLQREMDRQWQEYDNEITRLQKRLEVIGKELNQAVEDIAVVVIEFGQVDMFYDENANISYLINHLKQSRIDSLIENTPVLYKNTKLKQN